MDLEEGYSPDHVRDYHHDVKAEVRVGPLEEGAMYAEASRNP